MLACWRGAAASEPSRKARSRPISGGGGRSSGSNGLKCPKCRYGAGVDGDAALAGRIATLGSIARTQRPHTQTGAEPRLRVWAPGVRAVVHHHHLAEGGNGRAGLGRLRQHSGQDFPPGSILPACDAPSLRCAEGIWSATVTWPRRPGGARMACNPLTAPVDRGGISRSSGPRFTGRPVLRLSQGQSRRSCHPQNRQTPSLRPHASGALR